MQTLYLYVFPFCLCANAHAFHCDRTPDDEQSMVDEGAAKLTPHNDILLRPPHDRIINVYLDTCGTLGRLSEVCSLQDPSKPGWVRSCRDMVLAVRIGAQVGCPHSIRS